MASEVPRSADVVICGAGIAGAAAAYYLTVEYGVRDVLLVDRRAPLMLTSDKSVECYRNWWPDDRMLNFMNRSIDLMEQLAQESGNVFGLNRRSYAYVTTREDGPRRYLETVRNYDARGLGPIRVHDGSGSARYTASSQDGFMGAPEGADLLLDQGMISKHFPYLAQDVTAVLQPRRCGWLSAQQLGMYLFERAKAAGASYLRGTVTAIEQDKRGVSAVQLATDSGSTTVSTRRFVNAAGPFLAEVGAMLGAELPVRNVMHEKIVFKDRQGVVPRDAPLVILDQDQFLEWSEDEREIWREDPEYGWLLDRFPAGCHLRPEGGGDSTWLLIAWGFHTDSQEPSWDPEVSEAFPEVALRGAVRLVPGLREYVGRMPGPVMDDGGFYTKTAENLALIGSLGVEGAYVIGALSGYGVMAAPAAGELLAACVTGGARPAYAEAFSPSRYDDPAYVAALDKLEPSGEL